ncbi:HEAT repeat domain-containing protein [Providencia burhodogranariea]|uniref:HEAT repeat domain-containing protein n=1 Tax=Providencia burhodogranariea DSM 19968 TaxID=1141662 RepID=K8X644_9GAMM|nr:HEAT repeat domain-containing protein [Providencia burhodogranariea]EKT63905.1 hypothetical protein OOA_03559 [Providencia burhodogranariea DSM 19968]
MGFQITVVNSLLSLLNSHNNNDIIKITLISSIGDIKSAAEHPEVIKKLLSLCKDENKDIAIAAIRSLSKLLGDIT